MDRVIKSCTKWISSELFPDVCRKLRRYVKSPIFWVYTTFIFCFPDAVPNMAHGLWAMLCGFVQGGHTTATIHQQIPSSFAVDPWQEFAFNVMYTLKMFAPIFDCFLALFIACRAMNRYFDNLVFHDRPGREDLYPGERRRNDEGGSPGVPVSPVAPVDGPLTVRMGQVRDGKYHQYERDQAGNWKEI